MYLIPQGLRRCSTNPMHYIVWCVPTLSKRFVISELPYLTFWDDYFNYEGIQHNESIQVIKIP